MTSEHKQILIEKTINILGILKQDIYYSFQWSNKDQTKTMRFDFTDLKKAGICANVFHEWYLYKEEKEYILSRFEETWINWPLYSGERNFPILGEVEYIDLSQVEGYNFWSGKTLELRLSLINFLIKNLKP